MQPAQRLSRYPQIELAYTTATFERIVHSRGGSTRQIALIARDGSTFVMEPEWGLDYDRRNMRLGVWVVGVMAIVGIALLVWPF